MSDIKKGDRVAYKASFLRNTGQHTGAAPFARGTVTKIASLSKGGTKIATIKWRNDHAHEVPTKVNVANLVLEDRIHLEAPNPRRSGMKALDVFGHHQLKIARQTLKYSDVGAHIMGGMTKDEARRVIFRLTGRKAKENPRRRRTKRKYRRNCGCRKNYRRSKR